MCAIGLIIQTFRAYVVVILALLLRVANAIVKAWVFKKVTVTLPYSIYKLGIVCVENANPVFQYTDMAQADGGWRAGVFLRVKSYFVHTVLVLGYVGVVPWPNAVTRYTKATNIHIGS